MDANERDPAPEKRPAAGWTRVDIYLRGLARGRTARRRRTAERPRTEPETPQLSLSTLPFLALIVALGLLVVAIAILARPGQRPFQPEGEADAAERGTAPPGWFEEAKREMR